MPHKLLLCGLRRGPFSAEHLFIVDPLEGEEHHGLADSLYCFDANGNRRGLKISGEEGLIPGRIVVRVLHEAEGVARILVPPAWTVFDVASELLSDIPAEHAHDPLLR